MKNPFRFLTYEEKLAQLLEKAREDFLFAQLSSIAAHHAVDYAHDRYKFLHQTASQAGSDLGILGNYGFPTGKNEDPGDY